MNRKGQQLFIRIVCIILAILMAGSVLLSVLASTVGAASKSALQKLEDEYAALQQQRKDINAQINSLQYDEAVAMAKKTVLDNRMEYTQRMIDNLNEQIEEYGNLIEEKALEVEERQQEEEEQWELYKIRMRAMEENGTISYYAIIFGASSFADMLSRIDMVSSIMDHDKDLYEDLVTARHNTEDAKAALEVTKTEMEAKRVELGEAEEELFVEMEEAAALIEEITSDITQAKSFYDQVSEQQDKVKDKIVAMEEELKKQAAAAAAVGTKSFIWPTNYSNQVNSTFGPRDTGIPGASTNHKGVDLKTGYGTAILASDTGTVVSASYDSSYGYHVVISHGNGYTTLYAHMSKLSVSAGQTVTKGQTIGYSGSTGVANGPHLHFEIWYNGNRVNPLDFFDPSTYVIKE